jgi:hypothetical protein
VTWRKQRAAGLTPKKRGRQVTADPHVKQLEREKARLETDKRRLERRLQRAETVITFQKNLRAPGEPAETIRGWRGAYFFLGSTPGFGVGGGSVGGFGDGDLSGIGI